jgi:hypothetical protein
LTRRSNVFADLSRGRNFIAESARKRKIRA